jgi:hypothetical protein
VILILLFLDSLSRFRATGIENKHDVEEKAVYALMLIFYAGYALFALATAIWLYRFERGRRTCRSKQFRAFSYVMVALATIHILQMSEFMFSN